MGTKYLAIGGLAATAILGAACATDSQGEESTDIVTKKGVRQVNLVSDQPGVAAHTDPNLINSWGVAVDPEDGLFWIADNGTGKITIVDRRGNPATGEYTSDALDLGVGITGIVRNDNLALQLHTGPMDTECGTADFLVASETGKIFGINTDLNPRAGILFADRSAVMASYKGVAIGEINFDPIVYAADFHNGRIDVFDAKGQLIPCTTAFVDPKLPAGFAPFNVAVIGDLVYVAYAMQDAERADEVAGPGLGAISVFDASGKFLTELATGGHLNAPWAMTKAGSQLIVGNFGDGRITVFDLKSGREIGQLKGKGGAPLTIDGLWGIVPFGGNLYFAAGPDDETHGLFGRLELR